MWVTASVFAISTGERFGLLVITWSLLAALALSLLLYFVAPAMEGGTVLRLSGIFGSPNNLGRAAALAILLAIILAYYLSRWQFILIIGIVSLVSGVCLYLSGSRASTLGLVLGVAVVLMRRRPWWAIITVVLSFCGVLVLILMPELRSDLFSSISRSGRVNEVTTLTGRTEIWSWVLRKILDAPMIGYGFASTREVIPAGYIGSFGWTTTSAHNMWLQVWITTGALGLLFVVLSQVYSIGQFIVRPHLIRDGVLTFIVAIGLFEAGPFGPSVNLLTLVMFWAVALGVSRSSKNTSLLPSQSLSGNRQKET
jgi:O-antigen ligase